MPYGCSFGEIFQKRGMKQAPALTDFLNLNIGSATDAYLRELALVAIESRHLAHTLEQHRAYQPSLKGTAEVPKGKFVEGRYWVADDGTVTDQKTELMWMQSPLKGTFTFEVAQRVVKNLNNQRGFSGYIDWRMPTQDELFTLVVKGNGPFICQEAFPDTHEWFWTSTPQTTNAAEALIISFRRGIFLNINKFNFNHVRLVRGASVHRI